jgi:hypothetical protein
MLVDVNMGGAMRPQSIVRFEQIFFVYLIAGIAGTLWLWPYRLVMFYASPGATIFSEALPAGGAGLGFAVQLLLWWLIARVGSSIAKWVYIVLIACAGVALVASLAMPLTPPLPITLLITGLLVLRVAAAAMLLRTDAVDWLRRR